jgi:hypothetical protein
MFHRVQRVHVAAILPMPRDPALPDDDQRSVGRYAARDATVRRQLRGANFCARLGSSSSVAHEIPTWLDSWKTHSAIW